MLKITLTILSLPVGFAGGVLLAYVIALVS